MLGLFDRAEIDAVHQQLRGAQRAETIPDLLIDESIVFGAGFPAHAADQADGAHWMFLKQMSSVEH